MKKLVDVAFSKILMPPPRLPCTSYLVNSCRELKREVSLIVMRMSERIESKLNAAFAPQALSVSDDSQKHRGHAGWREGGETHFSVTLISGAFTGKSRIERHRMINAVLAEELGSGVHALAIAAKAPGE